MKRIGVLGSTGSVGSQTLEVIKSYREKFEVVGLVAKRASDKLLSQAIEFRPKYVVSYQEPSKDWIDSLPSESEYIKGEEGLLTVIDESDRTINAISGVDGILPTYYTLTKGKVLLASNKESIVCLDELVKEKRDRIIPIDSEHNAIFQLLSFTAREHLKKVYLTASGGPFREKSLEDLKHVSVKDALNHPRWKMGTKITIDSATLMNKGIEMMEAMKLFDLTVDDIQIVIHPQSVVHGIVELKDGSFLFHVSQTDMKVPILHALFYPERQNYPFEIKSLLELSPITFESVDRERFRAVYLCKWVAQTGGAYVPALLGADEAAVEIFLSGKIGFLDIVRLVEEVLYQVNMPSPNTLNQIMEIVKWAYNKGKEIAESYKSML
ncbi:MAG: 1-deoxy-D-xylulose-5-phosphate reductoisomerase [Aquificaceae bacterium]